LEIMVNFFLQKNTLITLLLFSYLLTACTLASLKPEQESEAPIHMNATSSEPTQNLFSLPADLYYLQNGQIWLFSADAQTQQQVTHESAPIDAFDISPTSGMLAYITDNTLIITDADGSRRQVLRAGATLTPIPDELARLNHPDHITTAMRTPRWSPDGKQIAFIENGVQVFDLSRDQVQLIWSQSIESSEPMLFESLRSWSPDGKYLLVSQYRYPIETLYKRSLGVLQLGGPLYTIGASAQVTFAWDHGVTHLYLANALVGSEKSLMRCELQDMRCTMIAEFEPARWYYYYDHPFVTTDERLLVFMGASDDFSERPQTFNLISTRLDGYNRNKLRNDGYLLESALWSPNGDGVLIVLAQDAGEHTNGSMLWLDINDLPAQVIPVTGASNLRWGLPSNE
jgi:dipeptidyl aminopeptidase/acylaminoacyl peptidase